MKKLAQDCYDMSQINHSYKQQVNIFNTYLQNVRQFKAKKNMFEITNLVLSFLDKFESTLENKIKALQEIQEVEQEYNKTLPLNEINKLKQAIKLYENEFEKFDDISL